MANEITLYEFVGPDTTIYWSVFDDYDVENGSRTSYRLSPEGWLSRLIVSTESVISFNATLERARTIIRSAGYIISEATVPVVRTEAEIRQDVAYELDLDDLIGYLLYRGRTDTHALVLADRINQSLGASRIRRIQRTKD